MVLDKPAGLPVHPGPRARASVEDCFPALGARRGGPWLAHRLDTDTSGCLLIALTKSALRAAQAEFAAGRAEKTYWAVVRGIPADAEGEIDLPLTKHNTPAGWRMVAGADGPPARSSWRVLAAGGGRALLEVRPRTGRTHQVRAHCAAIGHPILGDPIYGAPDGVALHLLARALRLALDPPVAALAPPPAHMRAALAALGVQPATGTDNSGS